MSGARDVGGGLVLTRRERVASVFLAALLAAAGAVLLYLVFKADERRFELAPERGGR